MKLPLPHTWNDLLSDELAKPYFEQLRQFVDTERTQHTVFPPEEDVFNALEYTPYEEARVLILGQDPYHDTGQAHGLAFSVREGIQPPPSLVNIYKELKADVGFTIPKTGSLIPWARQGVLLLNAVLTVRAHEPASHKNQGWETFTDAVIRKLNEKATPVVFVLWGAYARKKAAFVNRDKHVVIESAHPSPLSAKSGFFGSKPFSQVNAALEASGQKPINWQL